MFDVGIPQIDVTRATTIDEDVAKVVDNMFTNHPWDSDQIARGKRVRDALKVAFLTIIDCVPPCPDRSAALRKLRDARMNANSAITHYGRY